MQLADIVTFWSQQHKNPRDQWVHPADDAEFAGSPHSFNLDFPVSPYVGDILRAPIIILGANAGYKPGTTAKEFAGEHAVDRYVERVRHPSSSWTAIAPYYMSVNYGRLLVDGSAALINACPYRSPKISEERDNRRLLERLPSTIFTRRWLIEVMFPLAQTGERLIVAKRPGLWQLPPAWRDAPGVIFDPAPVASNLTAAPWAAVLKRLARAD